MPLQVNQLGVYGGFIGNYKDAVEVVRRSSQSDVRFRLLAEVTLTVSGHTSPTGRGCITDNDLTASLLQSMMPNNNNSSDKTQCKYTFEGAVSSVDLI